MMKHRERKPEKRRYRTDNNYKRFKRLRNLVQQEITKESKGKVLL